MPDKTKAVRLLKNHGAIVTSRVGRGMSAVVKRYVEPGGAVSILEAAQLLGTSYLLLYRMHKLGRLKLTQKDGRRMIRLSECRRLQKAWRGGRPTTTTGAAA